MKKLALVAAGALASVVILITACTKDDSNNGDGTTLRVRLTDAPLQADSVNVEIREVRVKFREDSLDGWTNLTTQAGVYNLLGLQNGVDTLIAQGTVPTDMVKEIRFVLGTNNSIVVNGVNYPLNIPSGSESGLKLKVDKRLNGSLDSLLIDFDAALSIHQLGNGNYQLKPVLKIK